MRLIDKVFEAHLIRLLGEMATVTDVQYVPDESTQNQGLIEFKLPLDQPQEFRMNVELRTSGVENGHLLCVIGEKSLSDQLYFLKCTLAAVKSYPHE